MTLFDAALARDEAMTRVKDHAPEEWKDAAWEFLNRYLREHRMMHVDDLWSAGLPEPPEMRALGPLFNRAARAGLMVKSGRFQRSVRSHLSEKPVWLSWIYEGEGA